MAENSKNYIDRITIRGNTYYLVDKELRDGTMGILPVVTEEDNGSFLMVSDGKWTTTKISDASGEAF